VHSPDPDYQGKLAHIRSALRGADPESSVFVCLDELTVYAHPTVCQAHGSGQPLAGQGLQANRPMRIIAALNLLTGRVNYLVRNKISVSAIHALYRDLAATYPGKQIYIVQDNWPVHYHPDLLAALQPQEFPYGYHVPASWKGLQPSGKYLGENLPVRLLALPTYASWLNVAEKLWRKLKQELLHMHPWKDQFALLRDQVCQWLDQYTADGPHQDLRRYVGLLSPNNFLGQIINEIYSSFKDRLFHET
jgi:hypothetical protein